MLGIVTLHMCRSVTLFAPLKLRPWLPHGVPNKQLIGAQLSSNMPVQKPLQSKVLVPSAPVQKVDQWHRRVVLVAEPVNDLLM
jgi:hypothetical protein